jgi:F-type H+-transporting ATPase subunit delta
MISGALAKRYARALAELTVAPMVADRTLKALESLAAASTTRTEDGALGALLDAGHLSLGTRLSIGRKVAQRAGADATTTRFIDLLIERGRFAGMPLIARHYRDIVDERAGRVRATVRSASSLAPDAVSKIKRSLEQATGKTVLLDQEVDPELIGGLVTHVGSFTIDRSVRASLERLRENLHGT